MRIYLDVCCLNRPFDNRNQFRRVGTAHHLLSSRWAVPTPPLLLCEDSIETL